MKILLVEDDKKIATVVKRGLEAEGFTVTAAASVKVALGTVANTASVDGSTTSIMPPPAALRHWPSI